MVDPGDNKLPPIEIPNFRLIKTIGQGGMGVVWLGQQEHPHRKVAVKIVAPSNNIPPALLEMLRQEGNIAAKFQHARLVTVYDCGLIDDHYYMVMELLTGGDLGARIRTGMDRDEALEVVISITSGLAQLHAKGLVHRDLKPANVLFTEQGGAVLTDFGISKAMDTEGLMTRLGYTTGTPAYMSPEQINGNRLDGRSDLYALGIVLFEMLTGRLPFTAHSDHRLKELQLNVPPPPLPAGLSNLQQLLDRLLAKDPEQRFEDAKALLEALHESKVSQPVTEIISASGRQAPIQARSKPSRGMTLSGKKVRVISLVVVLLAAVFLVDRMRGMEVDEPILADQQTRVEAPLDPSVAVLAFDDISPDQDQEYFADGLSDTLIHVLAQVSGLKVTAKTSSFYFKGKDIELSEIARKLNVGALLVGSVQKSGDRVRVIAQLINAGDGTHLWSMRFDRELQDIFAIQDEIAREVVRALKVTLLDAEEERLTQRYQPTLEAYGELILGRQEMAKRTADSLAAAEQHFKEAIELDPDYPLAYFGLADTYELQVIYSGLVWEESLERRRPLVEKALELNPLSGEAYMARAGNHQDRQELEAAEEDFLKAIELNPNHATARHRYSDLLGSQGRFEEALVQIRVAAELDPMAQIIQVAIASSIWSMGRVEEALTLIRRNIERNPEFPNNYSLMAEYQTALGHLGVAQRWIAEAHQRNPEGPGVWMDECLGFLHLGDGLSAERCGRQLSEAHPQKFEAIYFPVLLHMYREEWTAATAIVESMLERAPGHRFGTWTLSKLLASKGEFARARRLMADVYPELLKDDLELAKTDPYAALTFAAILNANGEIKRRDIVLLAMEQQIATMHRTRGAGYGVTDLYIHAMRGDRDRAIAALREAIDVGWRKFWWELPRDWKLGSLRQDPEFIALLNELEADILEQRQWYEANKDQPLL